MVGERSNAHVGQLRGCKPRRPARPAPWPQTARLSAVFQGPGRTPVPARPLVFNLQPVTKRQGSFAWRLLDCDHPTTHPGPWAAPQELRPDPPLWQDPQAARRMQVHPAKQATKGLACYGRQSNSFGRTRCSSSHWRNNFRRPQSRCAKRGPPSAPRYGKSLRIPDSLGLPLPTLVDKAGTSLAFVEDQVRCR